MISFWQAWIDVQVPQCGYCQSGQIMSAVALVEKNSNPSEEQIIQAMEGNLCRCGTYTRIKRAIQGKVHHQSSGRTFSYGELVEEASSLPVPENPRLKKKS